MNQNKRNGNRFEQEFAELLSKHGFWAHVFQQNKSGQPADIIAAKNTWVGLIDCKVVSDDRGFPFSRVEENQRLAMQKFQDATGFYCYFAIRLPDGTISLLSYNTIKEFESLGVKHMTNSKIKEGMKTISLDSWFELMEIE